MIFLDGTAVNVALPALARDLGAGFAGFQWVLNAYLVALAASVLPGGAVADRWGRRRTFQAGAAAFAVASLACAAAPSLVLLVAARALQGAAGGLLVPASLSLLQRGFDADDRGRAVGLWAGLTGFATLAGPLLGGWLADDVTWRAVFLLNAPVSVAAVALVRAAPEDVEAGDPERPLDVRGSLVGIPTFLGVERRSADPMLPLRYLRSRPFLGANLVTLGVYFALSGLLFLLAVQLQRVVGWSAFEAGAATTPITLIMLLLSPTAGRIAGMHGPEPLLAGGPLVAGWAPRFSPAPGRPRATCRTCFRASPCSASGSRSRSHRSRAAP
jgi:MFS family permease